MSFWQALLASVIVTSHFFSSLFSDSRFLINTWYNIAWRKTEQKNETAQWCFGGHTGVWEDLNFGCNYEQSACLEYLEAGILFCKQTLQLLCCYTAGMSMSMLYCKTASFFPPYCPKIKHNLSHQPSIPSITQVHLINSAEFFKKWFLSFQMSFSLIDLGETQAQFLANPELRFENWFCKSCWKKKITERVTSGARKLPCFCPAACSLCTANICLICCLEVLKI